MSQERTYALLLRVYTGSSEGVPGRVERAIAHIRQFQEVREAFPALMRIVILVPHDHDCGETHPVLETSIATARIATKLSNKGVSVIAPRGYHSCEVLNMGLLAAVPTVSHALIVSGKAMPYLNEEALRTMDRAFSEGAHVAGLAVDELRDIVLSGRVQNTFSGWNIDSLLKVGGFDSYTGVEEIAPLVRLARRFGRCIAPLAAGDQALDIHQSAEALERHRSVMAEKIAAQEVEFERCGAPVSYLEQALLESRP